MSIYFDLLLIAVTVTYVVDLSGWTDTWLGWLSAFTKRYGYGPVHQLRPFSCSQCMTWWCCILWALIRGELSLPVVAVSACLGYFSITVQGILIFISDWAAWLLDKLKARW